MPDVPSNLMQQPSVFDYRSNNCWRADVIHPDYWFFSFQQTVVGSTDINAGVSQVHSAIEAPKAAELAKYAHATLFSLVLDTLQKALRQETFTIFLFWLPRPYNAICLSPLLLPKDTLIKFDRIFIWHIWFPRVSLSLILMMRSLSKSHIHWLAMLKLSCCQLCLQASSTQIKRDDFLVLPSSGSIYFLVMYYHDCITILVKLLQNRKAGSILAMHKMSCWPTAMCQCSMFFCYAGQQMLFALQQFLHD